MPDGTADANYDRRTLTFSQAQGYEEVPGPLRLGELPDEARVRIWNAIYSSILIDKRNSPYNSECGHLWTNILYSKHILYDVLPLDEHTLPFLNDSDLLRNEILEKPFNKVFDLVQFVMRNQYCPDGFVRAMQRAFKESRLAYTIDESDPPTILPAVTETEGEVVSETLQLLRQAGLAGSAAHLAKASECIMRNDWAGSVRESMNAVESVARQLAPGASRTLGPALAALEKDGRLHPALKEAFSKLYGYTSDEQGIRHPLLDNAHPNVGMDEALFMLGACASFASYLWRRHEAGETNL